MTKALKRRIVGLLRLMTAYLTVTLPLSILQEAFPSPSLQTALSSIKVAFVAVVLWQVWRIWVSFSRGELH